MRRTENQRLHRGLILKTVLIFLVSYFVFLVLWVQVKDYYGRGIIVLSSELAAAIKDVKFQEVTEENGGMVATFNPLGYGSDILIDITVKTSFYTFNAPLTLGIMAALYLHTRKRRRAYGEALLILISVHILYVISLEAKGLTNVLTDRGIQKTSAVSLVFYQFLWSFTDNMLIRFEPFLIGIYVFIRFGRQASYRAI